MKKRIQRKNWDELIKWSEKYKKIDSERVRALSKEREHYMKGLNLEDLRTLFRKNSYLLHTIKLNWKNKYKNEGFECKDCLFLSPPVSHPDCQDMLLTPACVANSNKRQGRDMSNPRHQASVYRDIIARRNSRNNRNDTS